jgi:Zn-dependent alcohol dehydrogenase
VKVRAAVVDATDSVGIRVVDLDEPGPGEVLVRLVATGLCHTDVSMVRGNLPVPMPFVPGHEGAGIVEGVGPSVTGLAPGDHVICSIAVRCGQCYTCVRNEMPCEAAATVAFEGQMLDGTVRLHDNDLDLHHVFCQSSFAEYTVVPAVSTVKVREDAPLEKLAPLGCSVGTGLGAVMNRAKVNAGSSVLVLGAGGVGLAAMLGARAVGAARVIAADIDPRKLAKASALAADETINPSEEDLADVIDELTGGRGVDFAIDAVGAEGTVEQCFRATRMGGTTVAVGVMYGTNSSDIDTLSLIMEKTLTGSYGGSVHPWRDIPGWVDLYMTGRLDIGALVDHEFKLDNVGEAIDGLERGDFVRGVLHW